MGPERAGGIAVAHPASDASAHAATKRYLRIKRSLRSGKLEAAASLREPRPPETYEAPTINTRK
jgi:hypothetical protein